MAERVTREELAEALRVVGHCYTIRKTCMYNEDGFLDGWEWKHPDGKCFRAHGIYSDYPPMHPVAKALLSRLDAENGGKE